MSVFNISFNIEAIDDFSPIMEKMTRSFQKLNKTLTKTESNFAKFHKSAVKAGKSISLKAGAPLAAFGVFAVKAAVDFQRAINMVGADTTATSKQLEMLRKTALKYGASTQFTATEVANAEMFLGRAGSHVNEIMSMLPGVLQLAAASQLDMATASKVVIGMMKGYSFGAKDLTRVNNVLVKTFTSSNTDLLTLSDSFKLAGPVMQQAGVSFEDAATLVAVLGNSAIQSGMAGSGMRKVVKSLLNPTKQLRESMKKYHMTFVNANTGQLELIRSMTELHDAGLTTAGALEIFGVRGGNAMSAFMGHYYDMLKMNKAVKNHGDIAERIAKAQMMGLPGALKHLTSAFGNLRIEIVDGVKPELMDMMNWLAKVLKSFNKSSHGVKKATGYLIGFTIAIGPLLIALGKMALLISIFGKWSMVANIFKAVGVAATFMWEAITGPVGLIIAVGVALYLLYKHVKAFRVVVKGIGKLLYYEFIAPLKFMVKLIELAVKGFKSVRGGGNDSAMQLAANPFQAKHKSSSPGSMFDKGNAAVAVAASTTKTKSTLNINVKDDNNIIKSLVGKSNVDDFGMNVGTNMAYARE